MNQRTRILLSIDQQICRELLRHRLGNFADVEFIGESCDYIECLALIAQRKAQVWIHSAEDGPDLKAMLSRVFEIAPGLVVVKVNSSEPAAYLQVQVNSISEVLAFTTQWQSGGQPVYSH